jgi:hypothetical protein
MVGKGLGKNRIKEEDFAEEFHAIKYFLKLQTFLLTKKRFFHSLAHIV